MGCARGTHQEETLVFLVFSVHAVQNLGHPVAVDRDGQHLEPHVVVALEVVALEGAEA